MLNRIKEQIKWAPFINGLFLVFITISALFSLAATQKDENKPKKRMVTILDENGNVKKEVELEQSDVKPVEVIARPVEIFTPMKKTATVDTQLQQTLATANLVNQVNRQASVAKGNAK